MNLKRAVAIITLVLLIDQISKVYIKTHFSLGQEIVVFDWFRIHFLENNGMAWGAEFGGSKGKLFLTIFRLIAICGIGYWLYSAIKEKVSWKMVTAISLIFAGALGNIIDSVFYGVFFSSSFHGVAKFLPERGYSSFFHGKVVDMLYFPLINTNLPSWVPFFGGAHFTFFDPVFNIADSSITIGVMILIFFSKEVFAKKESEVSL
ncbi:MAG: lipoprotein signal peptidase [Flavobacteriaceae bacterium]|nr:lipoprotein signal peptidase [Flavobacteriaceae bacterium]